MADRLKEIEKVCETDTDREDVTIHDNDSDPDGEMEDESVIESVGVNEVESLELGVGVSDCESLGLDDMEYELDGVRIDGDGREGVREGLWDREGIDRDCESDELSVAVTDLEAVPSSEKEPDFDCEAISRVSLEVGVSDGVDDSDSSFVLDDDSDGENELVGVFVRSRVELVETLPNSREAVTDDDSDAVAVIVYDLDGSTEYDVESLRDGSSVTVPEADIEYVFEYDCSRVMEFNDEDTVVLAETVTEFDDEREGVAVISRVNDAIVGVGLKLGLPLGDIDDSLVGLWVFVCSRESVPVGDADRLNDKV